VIERLAAAAAARAAQVVGLPAGAHAGAARAASPSPRARPGRRSVTRPTRRARDLARASRSPRPACPPCAADLLASSRCQRRAAHPPTPLFGALFVQQPTDLGRALPGGSQLLCCVVTLRVVRHGAAAAQRHMVLCETWSSRNGTTHERAPPPEKLPSAESRATQRCAQRALSFRRWWREAVRSRTRQARAELAPSACRTWLGACNVSGTTG
jgi:hypothetical protein